MSETKKNKSPISHSPQFGYMRSTAKDNVNYEPTAPYGASHHTKLSQDDLAAMPKEILGRKGPEATRYGDWEVDGKCTDF